MRRNAQGWQGGLLPEAGSAFDGCKGVDKDQDQDAFDWAGYEAKCERLGVVFIPGLYVEGEECYRRRQLDCGVVYGTYGRTAEERHDRLPTHAKVLRGRKDKSLEGSVDCINAMIEKFAQWSRLVRSSSTDH